MPRIRPEDVKIEVGYWVYLNLKQNAIWKDEYSGISLDVWTKTMQQIPEDCDASDLRTIKKAVAFGRLFVSPEKPDDIQKAQEKGRQSIYLRELLTRSKKYIEANMDTMNNTDLEILHNLELQKGSESRKTVLKMLEKKIKEYASEFAVGIEGGGKKGMVERFVRQPVDKGGRPLKNEPPDIAFGEGAA